MIASRQASSRLYRRGRTDLQYFFPEIEFRVLGIGTGPGVVILYLHLALNLGQTDLNGSFLCPALPPFPLRGCPLLSPLNSPAKGSFPYITPPSYPPADALRLSTINALRSFHHP